MLTPQQFEAIGRLTLAFNDIEYMIEVYLAHMLGTPEWSVSVLIAEEEQFGKKAERFKRVLREIAEERPQIETRINLVLGLIAKAKELADNRNKYVHALVVHDFATNQAKLRMRREEIMCDEQKITDLAMQASDLAEQINTQCGELHEALEFAREFIV
jgi:hypothetical protein